jgi:preprotein translocase subunit Sec61beta
VQFFAQREKGRAVEHAGGLIEYFREENQQKFSKNSAVLFEFYSEQKVNRK